MDSSHDEVISAMVMLMIYGLPLFTTTRIVVLDIFTLTIQFLILWQKIKNCMGKVKMSN